MRDYAVYFRLIRNLTIKDFEYKKIIPIRVEKYLELSSQGEEIENPFQDIISGCGSSMTQEVLRYLINNENSFLEQAYANSNITRISLNGIEKDGSVGIIRSFSKSDLVMRIEIAYTQGLITEEEYKKTEKLRERVKFEQLQKEYEDETIHFKYHSGEYTIPIMTFFDILSLDKDQLELLITNSTIAGIPKEEFVASMQSFFRMAKPHEKYVLPYKMLLNKNYLENNVDTYAIDEFSSDLPEYVEHIKVDEELMKTILSTLPKDFTLLEQAYYIYRQLCKTFTYDEEWYASSGMGDHCNNHRDIEYISKLNFENNEVVCHDFNAIYSKFLEKLGISYNYTSRCDYGKGHAALEFVAGKFFVSADSVTSIILGDLPKAKLGQPLVGFEIKNYNQDTIDEFNQSLEKVDEYIKSVEQEQQNYTDIIEQYSQMRINNIKLSPQERRDILFEKINNSTLPVTDSLTYIHLLEKRLFPILESHHCKSYFVSDANPPKERDKSATVAVIICFNPTGDIRVNITENEYYTYIPTEGITKTSKEALQENIKTGRFNSISEHVGAIPGLNLESDTTYTGANHK